MKTSKYLDMKTMNDDELSDLKKHIHFILGEEARPKIETFGKNGIDIKNSIFYKQYRLALSYIADFINVTENADITYQSEVIDFSNKQNYNNILLFTGERGSGKTSCLLTISELLANRDGALPHLFKENIAKVENDSFGDKIKSLEKMSFFPCEIIDPTFFNLKNNILEAFIGGLFKRFKMLREERERKNTTSWFRGYTQNEESVEEELFYAFKDVQAHLMTLTREQVDESFDDDLENLRKLTAGVDFKKCIDRLLIAFLKYESGSTDVRKQRLVLCIDDIDLNMANAYIMVEQIRKYLCHPYLIVLMAVKIGQLSNVIKIKYFDDFTPLLKRQNMQQSSYKEDYREVIDLIVERYMTKLFPLNQRIYLPDTSLLFDKEIYIYRRGNDGRLEMVDKGSHTVFRNELLHLIYRKIRMLFYNTSKQTSYIIPRNLRELRHLVRLLYNMKDASGHEEAVENLMLFKQYFNDMWCTNNLDEDGRHIMKHIWNVRDANVLNKTVVQLLKQRFNMDQILKENPDTEISQIIKSGNVMYNVSLGDVLACFDWLDKICYEENEIKLIFAIKTFYSIRLYEGFRYKKELIEEDDRLSREVVNKELLTRNKTAYGDIINGGILNSEYLDVVPSESGKNSRSRRMINAECLSNLISYVICKNDDDIRTIIQTINEKEVDKINIDELLNIKGRYDLLQKIVEFFMLTTSFLIDSKDVLEGNPKTFTDNHRTRRTVYYESLVYPKRKYACFDLLYIFYSLSNVENAYKRYDNYLKCNPGWHSKGENGLYQSILKYVEVSSLKSYYQVLSNNEESEMQDDCKGENKSNRFSVDKVFSNDIWESLKKGLTEADCSSSQVIEDKIKKYMDKEQYKDNKDEPNATLRHVNTLWKGEGLRYKINIRNIEILEQISYLLQRSRSDGNSDNVKVLQSVFDTLSTYEIVPYNGESINFQFFKGIRDFFEELDEKEHVCFKRIFNYIYTLPDPVSKDTNKS